MELVVICLLIAVALCALVAILSSDNWEEWKKEWNKRVGEKSPINNASNAEDSSESFVNGERGSVPNNAKTIGKKYRVLSINTSTLKQTSSDFMSKTNAIDCAIRIVRFDQKCNLPFLIMVQKRHHDGWQRVWPNKGPIVKDRSVIADGMEDGLDG